MKFSRAWPGKAAGLALRAAGLYAVWLLIDDNVSQPELYAGIVVALLALALAVVVTRSSTVDARFRLAMFRYLYRTPLLLVGDSLRLCWILFKGLLLRRRRTGALRAVRYRATDESADDVGRRVLTSWAASIAPNRYVIGIDTEARVLLVHELVETKGPLDPLELG